MIPYGRCVTVGPGDSREQDSQLQAFETARESITGIGDGKDLGYIRVIRRITGEAQKVNRSWED